MKLGGVSISFGFRVKFFKKRFLSQSQDKSSEDGCCSWFRDYLFTCGGINLARPPLATENIWAGSCLEYLDSGANNLPVLTCQSGEPLTTVSYNWLANNLLEWMSWSLCLEEYLNITACFCTFFDLSHYFKVEVVWISQHCSLWGEGSVWKLCCWDSVSCVLSLLSIGFYLNLCNPALFELRASFRSHVNHTDTDVKKKKKAAAKQYRTVLLS